MNSQPPSFQSRSLLSLSQDSLAFALFHAARLVAKVIEGSNLTVSFEKLIQQKPDFSNATRSLIRDLTWATLRHYAQGDAILKHLLHKPLPTATRALLLVAVYRLEQRPEQAYTTVNQAVYAANIIQPKMKGVVNGVLRNVIRQISQLTHWKTENEESRYCYPSWWIKRIRQDYPDQWETILAAGNTPPPMTLRINPYQVKNYEEVQSLLTKQDIIYRQLKRGALLLDHPVPTAMLPGFKEGKLSVQDAGAQEAAFLLNPKPGDRVLDACAAPGGKTAHLLEYANIDLLALELDPSRAKQLSFNLERLGLKAAVHIADCKQTEQWWDGRPFDRILADVPCSASGIVRRHPDIKWLRRNEDIAFFVRQQASIINALWRTLAPGGTMLYATCSVFSEENHLQIEQFCKNHPDAERGFVDGCFEYTFLPAPEHDGFYYARLCKRK